MLRLKVISEAELVQLRPLIVCMIDSLTQSQKARLCLGLIIGSKYFLVVWSVSLDGMVASDNEPIRSSVIASKPDYLDPYLCVCFRHPTFMDSEEREYFLGDISGYRLFRVI